MIEFIAGKPYLWDGLDTPKYFVGHCGRTDNPIFAKPGKIGNASLTMEELSKRNIRKC